MDVLFLILVLVGISGVFCCLSVLCAMGQQLRESHAALLALIALEKDRNERWRMGRELLRARLAERAARG